MGIKISVKMAIMSHLSDVQELTRMGVCQKTVQMKLDFVKHMLLKYSDTSVELSNEELNKEWEEVIK